MINQKYLKSNLYYDPDTGFFVWVRGGCGRRRNRPAGCVERNKHTAYVVITLDGVPYKAHRLAFLYMTGMFPNHEVDHIDGNGCNNRWDNLRETDDISNQRNRMLFRNNTSGVTGVRWRKDQRKWLAYIYQNNKEINLGRFDCKQDAISARKKAEKEYGYHENHGRKNPGDWRDSRYRVEGRS